VVIQTAALGFPAKVAWRYAALRQHSVFRHLARPAGPYVYQLLAYLGLATQKRRERRDENLLQVKCTLPGEPFEETVFAIFIGNERSIGGNFHPCPLAEVDDGQLDLCFVRAGTGQSYLELFRALTRGEHLALNETIVYRQTQGPVELELSLPCSFLADGDLWVKDKRFRLEVLPRRFEVVTG
jgi:diacylglycerol kinase family enzyme